MRCRLAVLFVIVLVLGACGGGTGPSSQGWQADLDTLADELAARHVDAFHTVDETAFLDAVETARGRSDAWATDSGYFEIARLVGLVGDGHTTALWVEPFERYPFAVSRFSDGLFVLATDFDNRDLLGAQLLAVDGIPVERILEAGAAFVSGDTTGDRQLRVADLINVPALLDAAGLERSEPGTISVQEGDRSLVRPMTPSTAAMRDLRQDPDRPPLLIESRPGSPYWSVDLPEHDAIYVNYRQAVEAPDLSMSEFAAFVTDSADQLGATRLVIDLRQNGGGNSTVLDPMIQALRSHPLGDDVVVLIGQRTYSSAVLNAVALRDELGATLVGDTAGSTVSHFGEVETFTLPESSIIVSYSEKFFDRGDDGPLSPDLAIAFTSDDFAAGVDPQLDAALELER